MLFWSTGFIVARAVTAHADVQYFLLWRFAATAAIWGLAAGARRGIWPPPGRALQHVGAGAAMMGLYLCLSFWAIAQGLPAGIMALLGALQPLFTAALLLVRGKEAPSGSMWRGLAIGLFGVVLVLLPRIEGAHMAFANFANVIGMLAIVALTLGTLVQKNLGDSDLRISSCLQNIGATLVASLGVFTVGALRWDGTQALFGLLLWSVIITSMLGQGLLMWMMRRAGAAHVTALMLLVPPVAALLAYAFFHETLTVLQMIGFALALSGVVMARRAPRY